MVTAAREEEKTREYDLTKLRKKGREDTEKHVLSAETGRLDRKQYVVAGRETKKEIVG